MAELRGRSKTRISRVRLKLHLATPEGFEKNQRWRSKTRISRVRLKHNDGTRGLRRQEAIKDKNLKSEIET